MTTSTYPNMVNNFDASAYPYQPSQQQTQALVPAIAPGRTIYNNYTFPTTSNDLIDFGDNASTDYGSAYSSQQSAPTQTSTTDDDLMSFDDNNNIPFAMSPAAPVPTFTTVVKESPPTTRTTNNTADNLKALQDRDDEFIKSLPIELIEEQKRIISQIQESNRSANNSSQLIVSAGQQQYEQKFDALPDVLETSLPAEVHPNKYTMKAERKVKTAASASAGAVIGSVVLLPIWPIGAIVGAAVGGYAGKVVSRSGERKKQRKWDEKNLNEYTAQGICDVQSAGVTFA